MVDLKLAKLPDRTPVKIMITVSPSLKAAMDSYTSLYNENFDASETTADLIPFILESFLKTDRGFAKARKGRQLDGRGGVASHAKSSG